MHKIGYRVDCQNESSALLNRSRQGSNVKTEMIERDMKSIGKHAEKIRNDATEKVETMSVGDVVRQGDIYITRIASLPKSAKLIKDQQLAPGTTQGSRHTLNGGKLFKCDANEVSAMISAANSKANVPIELVGPVFVPDADVTIKHPEHAWRILPAECVGAIVYQRAFADTIRRVQD
jgi:hypothetical protein